MSADLERIRDWIQEDVGQRGLATDPKSNLINACPTDFAAACRSIAATAAAHLLVVTGFFIPQATPPAGETDGPLGALFLARALVPLGIKVTLLTDAFCVPALEVGRDLCGLTDVAVQTLPSAEDARFWQTPLASWPHITHLIALERVGPSHTPASIRAQPGSDDPTLQQFLREVPPDRHDRCQTMKGRDITHQMAPAHRLFANAILHSPAIVTIGIGDGGNEIGMGKIPWEVIRRNIPNGGPIACRVATDYLIVCGVSNWGAYGLAAGVRRLRGAPPDPDLFDLERERSLLRVMVEQGPLVDGVLGRPEVSVDGLAFERYAEPLRRLGME